MFSGCNQETGTGDTKYKVLQVCPSRGSVENFFTLAGLPDTYFCLSSICMLFGLGVSGECPTLYLLWGDVRDTAEI